METWQNPYKKPNSDHNNLKKIVLILVAGGVFVAAFLHMIFWGPYAFTILGLKLKSMSGSISDQELAQMADICYRRGSNKCYVESYQTILRRNPTDTATMAQLAKAFRRSKMTPNAIATFEMYKQAGGNDPQALYDYAKLMGETGDLTKASEIFQSIIDSRPGILQVTVTQAYVEMLIKNQRPKEAKAILDAFHQRSPNAKSYLQSELKQLDEMLRQEIGGGGIEKVNPEAKGAPSPNVQPKDLPTRKELPVETMEDTNDAPPMEIPVEDSAATQTDEAEQE